MGFVGAENGQCIATSIRHKTRALMINWQDNTKFYEFQKHMSGNTVFNIAQQYLVCLVLSEAAV